jgi:pimeloyl-ACP methyl ester carboxylesterase
MRKYAAVLLTLCLSTPVLARIELFPPAFKTEMVATNGTSLHVRVGGKGPAVVLLHGYGETGDMWAPLAAVLVKDHTVVVPDLRGMGLSERPSGSYDKKTQGQDIAGLLDALKIGKVDLVTHDIGNMVGYAFAAEHPDRVMKFVIMDAPLPGVGPWDDIVRTHALWHFSFYGPDAERLVKGREPRSISTGFGTSSRPTRKTSTRNRASTMLRSMRGPARCMLVSSSSRLSIRTPATTRRL